MDSTKHYATCFDYAVFHICCDVWLLVYMEIAMIDFLITPVKFKRYQKRQKESKPRSRYTRRFVPVKRKSHRSLVFAVKTEAKKIKIESLKIVKNAHRPKSRAVIRPVHINDIQFADSYGYVLSYCKWDEWKVNVVPVCLHFARYEEAYHAFKEAYLIQTKQGII